MNNNKLCVFQSHFHIWFLLTLFSQIGLETIEETTVTWI